MPIRHSIWRVGQRPQALKQGLLESEALLEDMIVAAPEILSPEWMIIGRQEYTGHGGRIDLLALAPDGALILVELKRARTPRDVVAQAIDYAVWAESLEADDIGRIYSRFSGGGDLGGAYYEKFGQLLDEDTLNESHQIVIVASSLDASSERIVEYLNQRDIPINVLCFQVFESSGGPLLSRVWLHDPVETQVAASTTGGRPSEKEPWNGEYYVSFGHGMGRSWKEASQYGFVSAGGGSWYSGTLNLLEPGDRIWIKVPGSGFVGVGRVTEKAVPAADFQLPGPGGALRPALDVLTEDHYMRDHVDDSDLCEYFVAVDWIETVPLEKAFNEVGLFGNQNTVCAPKTPKWRHTVERLKQFFRQSDAES
ncbi:hypothetical protein [Wenzhouxiangella sp. EGI_FJ10305]|uniref:hypothetical protein n=1 Tax=Wenzhouxiangella sp. EGI_FJ10305 TaxID=3243768 RepID=UPI0035D60DC4